MYGKIKDTLKKEIEEIFGETAINIVSDYIYNINYNAVLENNIITSECNLELTSNYKIFTTNGEKKIIIEDILENNQYKISGYYNNSNEDIFIQGHLVNDFHVLDKNAIFTVNVGATQELYKIIKNQELMINNLISRIEILENAYKDNLSN